MKKVLVFPLILNALLANALNWEEPYLIDPGSEHVQVDGQTIYLDENVANESIAIIHYLGDPEDVNIIYLLPKNGGELTGLEVRKRNDSKCDLVNTKSQDYESGNIKYDFDININGVLKQITLNINNVNDNAPQFIGFPSTCYIKEDTFEVDCSYIVEDRDGDVEDLTWTINGESDNEIFKLDSEKVSDIRLKLNLGLKKKLDFMVQSIYILDFEVSDQVDTAKLRVVVQVEDIPNLPPTWIRIFQSQQFNEKESQIFTVVARDGDIGINDDITYKITFKKENWENYITIDQNTGEISVEPIDRDAEQCEIYEFTVTACEVQMPKVCIDQEVTFIVNDINDHAPVFTLTGENTLLIEESKISTIDTRITVKDIDSGENARYTLKLSSEKDYEKAFTVAPSSGYNETDINLLIVNATLLDYEDDDWRKFSFQLVAEENVKSTEEHQPITFNIELINRNDELPIFTKCEGEESTEDVCVVKEEETFAGDTLLVTMKAEDGDLDGWVTYELLGTSANRILKINETTGEIFTLNLERPFDYETLPEVVVEVQAKDYVEGDNHSNIVITQLIIKLIDVNDETPTISANVANVEIFENLKNGEEIGVEITAVDDDSTAELDVNIDWDKSYALKNGVTVDDNIFDDYREWVKLNIVEDTGKLVRATLRINEVVNHNTPDFETFDTVHLEIVVLDKNQSVTIYPDNTARINIKINVQDVNDNPPVFESYQSPATFLYDDKKDTVLAQIPATDPDISDTLHYTISTNTDNFPEFVINNEGTITLNSDASGTLSNYGTLTITVSDTIYNATAPLEVYMISEEKHIVEFIFENEETTVTEQKDNIQGVLMGAFESQDHVPYSAYVKRIIKTKDRNTYDGVQTTVEVYFINTKEYTPIEKSEIERLANDIKTYANLRNQFKTLAGGLDLISFAGNDVIEDNTVEVLKAWLIGVAVILGCLCIVLIVAFVLKTRSLTARLNKLSVTKYGSQESGLNRKVVPNTNRHALEGSNPAYNIGQELPEYDQVSIGSGDSDLIGVENNPDFDRNIEKGKY